MTVIYRTQLPQWSNNNNNTYYWQYTFTCTVTQKHAFLYEIRKKIAAYTWAFYKATKP